MNRLVRRFFLFTRRSGLFPLLLALSSAPLSHARDFDPRDSADPWWKVVVAAELPFVMSEDALCFRNADPGLAFVGVPGLGDYGVETGVCQGMAGIAAAFRENVEFRPNSLRESPDTVEERIRQIVRAHQSRSGARFWIAGFRNLQEFCRENREAFLRQSIWVNAEIAADEILAVYPQFRDLKNSPLERQPNETALRKQLRSTLTEVLSQLRDGRYPLLLFHSHVILVRSYGELEAPDGERKIELEAYDSNHALPRTLYFPMGRDGLPSAQNYMHWVVSPR